MQLQAPDYANRTPEQIISEVVHFDSVGYVYRSLSWLDVYKPMRLRGGQSFVIGGSRFELRQVTQSDSPGSPGVQQLSIDRRQLQQLRYDDADKRIEVAHQPAERHPRIRCRT